MPRYAWVFGCIGSITSLRALTALALIAAALPASSAIAADRMTQPLRFFEGRTEIVSIVKVVMKKPYRSRTIGRGQILPDGSLSLVQQVNEDGQPPHQRTWRIKQIGPGKFTGTMSEAVGQVTVEEVGNQFRFKFRMKGSLSVEQWVTPQADGRTAQSKITVKKYGMRVASSDGMIKKL